jgi:hypothetical protein
MEVYNLDPYQKLETLLKKTFIDLLAALHVDD